ncbi:MAG: DUF4325 domain-containing protein [Propionibacteriaceae bacterium]|jgi:anti-sigma regulatory factor (Ser/Thr protein kinase)|nr:DUF4325 domain-containing protein [Propionibacteriaceae bacterium]
MPGKPLRIGEAARLLGVSPSQVRLLTSEGVLSSSLTPGGHRHYDRETLMGEWKAWKGGPDAARPNEESAFWSQTLPLRGLHEEETWGALRSALVDREGAVPKRADVILAYSVTEMVNNAIDHSGGAQVTIGAVIMGRVLTVTILDDGVGAFQRMADEFSFAQPEDALVEITKGKRTTAPDRHSGEGIFFTSKAVDVFTIAANGYAVMFDNLIDDIALGESFNAGTEVTLRLDLDTTRELVDVFKRHTEDGEFVLTTPRISLIDSVGGFISRSEAKRFALGLEQFTHVILDFTGVTFVGQGFADELFRVWQNAHPDIQLDVSGANPAVDFMINRVDRPSQR